MENCEIIRNEIHKYVGLRDKRRWRIGRHIKMEYCKIGGNGGL